MSSRLSYNAAASLSYERRASVDTFIAATRENSGNSNLLVSSAERSSSGQAKAMLDNYNRNRAYQRSIYGSAGQQVLDYFDAHPNQSYQQKIYGASNLIDRLATEGKPVSRHLSSFQRANNLFTFDIGYGSIDNKLALIDNLKKAGANVVLNEPKNNCIHIEISAANLKNANIAYLNTTKHIVKQPKLRP